MRTGVLAVVCGSRLRRAFRGCREGRMGCQAGGTVAAYFGPRDGYFHIEIAGDLLFELFVEAALKFADFAATQASHMNMVARAVTFVVVAIAAQMQQVQLIDEPLFFKQVDGAI